MKIRQAYSCPLEMSHDIIKGKWKPIILWQLSKQNCSLSELRKSIQGVSQKMLLQHLHDLIAYGMVAKTRFNGYPLQSEYALSKRGKHMLQAITIMQEIGIEIMLEDDRQDVLIKQGLLVTKK